MKKIEAIIRHFKLDDVKAAVTATGIEGMTVSETRGCGRHKPHSESYRGAEYEVDLTPHIKVEIVVADQNLEPALAAVIQSARTGEAGDGVVFVVDLVEAIRVRTGEVSDAAV